MRDKYGDPYIPLVCGHITSASDAKLFQTLAPLLPKGKRGANYWCESCETWKPRRPKPKREPLPEEPMF